MRCFAIVLAFKCVINHMKSADIEHKGVINKLDFSAAESVFSAGKS